MSFDEAYNYIISLSNLPRKEYMKDPRQCKVYMKRLHFFLEILGHPQHKIPHYIHVAGTSGKGSVTANMHAILHAAGKKVGSTYSPHPMTIMERWRFGNRYMSKKEFISLVSTIRPALDTYARTSPYDMLSFFEVIEAIGFLWFASLGAEWVILETGCGGRHDSSNVVSEKDIVIITNIGLDHTDIFGNDLLAIAWEKAGIINCKTTVYTSEKRADMMSIIEREAKKTKSACFRTMDTATNVHMRLKGNTFVYNGHTYQTKAFGRHQVKNAIVCIRAAQHLHIAERHIRRGLQKAVQPLRMEVVANKPTIILDGAHNMDKMKSTVAALVSLSEKKAIHVIVGCSADKNVHGMIRQLTKLSPVSIACTRNTINPFRKVAAPQDIAKYAQRVLPHSKVEVFLHPADALAWTKKYSKVSDIVLVTGSIFMAGEIRAIVLHT